VASDSGNNVIELTTIKEFFVWICLRINLDW
jgi:hypothetical protein